MNKKVSSEEGKIEELEKALKDVEDKWRRALADYQNLEKRTREERGKLIKYASEELITKLLPVLDNLEKAADHLNDEGLNLALKQLRSVLTEEGLVRLETLGQAFNPEEMEALETVKGEEEDKVRKEFRSGYKIHGRVIRAAQVQIEKREKEKDAEELAKGELQKSDYM